MDVDITLQSFADEGIGLSFEVCRDGAEAIDFVDASAPGDALPLLVLCDVRMPKVDGYGVLAHVRAVPEWSGVPVVMLTTSDEASDVERAHALGASGYLVKPVDPDAFRVITRQIFDSWIDDGRG